MIGDLVIRNLLLYLFPNFDAICMRNISFFNAFIVILKKPIFCFSDAPERICEKKDKVVNTIKTLLGSDVVALAQNGVRVCGYFFAHLMKNNEELTTELIQPFCRYVLFHKILFALENVLNMHSALEMAWSNFHLTHSTIFL